MILQGQTLVQRLLHSVRATQAGHVWRAEESPVGYRKRGTGQMESRLHQAAAVALLVDPQVPAEQRLRIQDSGRNNLPLSPREGGVLASAWQAGSAQGEAGPTGGSVSSEHRLWPGPPACWPPPSPAWGSQGRRGTHPGVFLAGPSPHSPHTGRVLGNGNTQTLVTCAQKHTHTQNIVRLPGSSGHKSIDGARF